MIFKKDFYFREKNVSFICEQGIIKNNFLSKNKSFVRPWLLQLLLQNNLIH